MKDVQRREPDLKGEGVSAWKLTISPTEKPHASLAHWLLNVPGAHPFWAWWHVSLIHLRTVPGLPPPVIHSRGATHEILVLAVNPEKCPQPDPSKESFPYLTPPDVETQCVCTTDDQAVRMLAWLVGEVVAGKLSPDEDHRACWTGAIRYFLTPRN